MSDFYNTTRAKFPLITAKADKKHIEMWDELDPEMMYLWFESLANAINQEMCKEVDPANYTELFNYFSATFNAGDDAVRNCIDVSFTENLFWQVPFEKASVYWQILPDNLKTLYMDFHKKEPG